MPPPPEPCRAEAGSTPPRGGVAPGNCSPGARLGGALRAGRRGQRRAAGAGCVAEAGTGSWSPDSRAGRGCPGAGRSFPPLLWTLTGGQRAGGGRVGGGQAARGGGSRRCGALIGRARVESGDGKRSAAVPSSLAPCPPPFPRGECAARWRVLTLAGFGCCRQELGGGGSGRSSGGGSSGSWEEVVTVATAASGTMARLVAVCRDGEEEFPFERRQIPLYIDDTLTVSGPGRVGPAALLAAVSLLPLPQAERCAHWRKSVLQLLGEAAFSPTGPTNSPLQWAPPYTLGGAPSPAPRTHFEVLSSGLPPFQNPVPL